MRESWGPVWGAARLIVGVLLLVISFMVTMSAFWMPIVIGLAAGHLIGLGILDWIQFVWEGRRS